MMTNKPKVSIITITYNHEKYIHEALDSFLTQKTDFDFEIIIADDASTDKTQKIIKEYAERDPDIFRPILRKKNIGAINNSNDALRAARGKYIALCEGDDYWIDNTKLQRQVDLLDKNPKLGLCFHLAKVFHEDGEQSDYIFPNLNEKPKFTTSKLLKHNFIMTNSVMYRRQNYDKLPNNILPLDWYYHLYHAKFGKIGFIDHVMSAYRRHSSGIWWASGSDDRGIWKKHGSPHLNFYIEILKLYGDNEKTRQAMGEPIKKMFGALSGLDKEYEELLIRAMKQFPEIAAQFITEQRNELNQKSKETEILSEELEKRIQIYDGIVKELNLIQNSKSWVLAQKLTKAGKVFKNKT